VLMVLCRKYESVHIFRIIKSIDEHAIISQANVNGAYGLGFDELKVRVHKSDTATTKSQSEQRTQDIDPVGDDASSEATDGV